ncbi:MAG: threonine-phosphate decarboxylase CobD [Desulfatitalea sp.]
MIHGHGGNIHALAHRLGCRPEEIIDVSSNINPLGPPPGLMAYLKENMAVIGRLPEVDSHGITAQMASSLGVDPECVLAGAGTTQFIYTLFPALASRQVLIVGPTYADYADACRLHHIEPQYFMTNAEDCFQPDRVQLDQQSGEYDTVVICNPNNPTGVLIPREALSALCRRHPDTRFVIDESYLPFVPDAEGHSMVASGLENVIVLHSLSKIYRLPGLRIGFAIGAAPVIARLQRCVTPWSLNTLAQAAVAYIYEHGEEMVAFIEQTRRYVVDERQRFFKRLRGNGGWTCYPSQTSYFLIRLPEAMTAAGVCARFARERILVRDCSNFYGLSERFIRVAIHQKKENDKIAEMLVGRTHRTEDRC